MSSLSRELVFLILQFLDEEKFKETVHRLEQESGFFFNMRHFEEMVTNGEWDEVEKYLSGFTKVDDNRYSMKIFFEIRKQKYLEALDKKDRAKAVDILVKDLKVFSAFNEDLFKEITQLLTLENFRDNEQLSKYGDTKSARGVMLAELKKLIEANPLFRDKLNFPSLKNSRLRTLINQSLNWQHQLCKNPKPNPDIKTLFIDHSCGQSQPNGARAPSPVTNSLMGPLPKPTGFPPLGAHGPFQPAPAPLPTSLAGWMANPSPVAHPSASAGPIGFTPPNNAALLKRPRTPPTNSSAIDYQTADSEHVLKRSRPFGISDDVNNLPVSILPVGYTSQSQTHGQSSFSSDDLPKAVVMTLSQGSAVKSMDFHPLQQILLLVGTITGEIMVWELGTRERLAQRNFKVWEHGSCSMPLQASLANDYSASVNCVIWSPDGTLFGVAYSKHIVHLYSYHNGDDLQDKLEIEAHVGSVNDLAFSYPNKQLCVVTCGEDRLIKVWDANTGAKQYAFEGHEAPVYSVCPHHKENIQFIFSTATDGKIKAWLYDNMGSRVDYDAPGHSSTTMAYSADGTRLFSCGTNKEGDSYIVEWNESEGAVKRTYIGLGKRSVGVVQFDTTKNRFLAAGDEYMVKYWDMDNVNLLTTADAEGGLQASPCIRFNKEGILLAVSTNDNGIKILANTDGIRLLRTVESRSFDTSRISSAAIVKRYDPDPAAKAAAATVLASKLGADSGLKVYMGDDTKFNPPTRMSSDVEHVQSSGLRKRKQSVSRSSSAESAVLHQLEEEMMQYTGPEGPEMSKHNQLIVEHQNPTNLHTQDGGWIARIAALLVGEDPTQSYALICGNCHMHNGLARKEDFPYITYYCPHCKALNRPKQVEGHASDSLSPNMDTSLVSSPIMGPSTPLGDVSMVQSAGGSMSDKASDSSSPMAAVVESIEETEPIVPKSHVS